MMTHRSVEQTTFSHEKIRAFLAKDVFIKTNVIPPSFDVNVHVYAVSIT